ncbi:MAG: hypothetical protein AAGA56_07725 [Myxococcota bacterium]
MTTIFSFSRLFLLALCFVSLACDDSPGGTSSTPASAATSETLDESPPAVAVDKSPSTDCKAFSAKIIDLLSEQGEQAFLEAKHTEPLAAACQREKTLETEQDTVTCVMKVSSLKDAQGCKDLNRVLKGLMKTMK